MATPKPRVGGGALRVKVYPVLADAVEVGIARGMRQAHKHTDTPEPEAITETILREVLSEICERFEVD